MLKQEVIYEDFNGEEQVETLYFNLTKAELATMMMEEIDFGELDEDGQPANRLADRINNAVRSQKGSDIVAMLNFILKWSYGERSEDGKRFYKSEKIWEDWKASGSYDAFFMNLLTDTTDAVEFVNGVMPSDIAEAMNEDPEFARHKEELLKRQQQ